MIFHDRSGRTPYLSHERTSKIGEDLEIMIKNASYIEGHICKIHKPREPRRGCAKSRRRCVEKVIQRPA